MNYQKRPPENLRGGADRRPQSPQMKSREQRAREQRLKALQMGQAPAERERRPEYTQMPLRPMTSMPRERQRPQGQRPPEQRRMPPAQGQRPPMQGQRPPAQGQQMHRPRPGMPPIRNERQTPPRNQLSRPASAPQRKGQVQPREAQPAQRKRPPEKRQGSGWVIPEGSPVYTAEGRMYDGRMHEGRRPDPRQGAQRRGQPPRRPVGAPPQNVGKSPRRPVPPKKKKTFNKDKFVFWIKTFFVRLSVMLFVVALLGFWWYRAEFYSETDSRSGKVSFVLDGIAGYETKASLAYKGDVLYCDFTEMADWFGMVSVGSVNSMRFICTEGVSKTSAGEGGEEYAIFTSGSTTVLVNGTSMSLEAPCRTVDSHIWIPLSFVENYVSGVICDRGAKGTNIVITPEGADEKNDGDEEIEINASFKIKAQTALKNVEYPG